MSNQISEELPARKHPQANAAGGGDAPTPKDGGDKKGGDAPGGTEEASDKRIRQAVYDIRYRARREDIDLRQAFTQYMSNSNLSQAERTAVRGKLFGKEGGGVSEKYGNTGQVVSDAVAKAFDKVFVEGTDKDLEFSYLEELKGNPDTKYKVRVTDAKTERTYVRYADRNKITQLRQNPNISSVEMTDYGEPYEGGRTTDPNAPKKAKKDFDGDGKKESSSKEHAGVVHNAIQRKKGGNPDGQDTRKEEFIADANQEVIDPEQETPPEVIDVMKGKNKIKINPKVSEDKKYGYDKEGKSLNPKDKEDEKKEDPIDTAVCKDPDYRSMKTRADLMRNKLRARGLNMSHELEGEDLVEEFINESVDLAADYFIKEGINEDGLEKIVDLVGLEDFTEFVLDLPQNLNEEREATRAPKRDYAKVKAAVYKKDAERKEKGTGEYSTTKAAKAKYGDEEAPEGKPETKSTPAAKPKTTPAAKVATATKTAKKTQVSTSSDKKGLVSKIKGFVSKGIERHQKAREAGRVPEARAKEFGKGVASGVKTAVNVAKVAYKATQPASKTTQKATTKAQKAADQDKDGKVRTVDAGYEPEGGLVDEEKRPFPHQKVARKLSSLDDKMRSKEYGFKRSTEKNRSFKISGIEDAVKRGEDPRKDTRGGAFAKRGNPDHDHRADYSDNKRKRTVKPSGVQKAVTKAQKAADQDKDGKVRTVDASYKPEAPAISEDLLNKMSRFMPKKSQELDELNRYEKETGTSSGSAGTSRGGVNTPRKGTPTKKGGSDDKIVHFGKGLVRSAEGRPTGQTRSSYDKRGEENNTPSPVQRIKKHLEDKRRNERRPTQGRYPKQDEKAEREYQAKQTAHQEKKYPNSGVVSGTVPGGKGVK